MTTRTRTRGSQNGYSYLDGMIRGFRLVPIAEFATSYYIIRYPAADNGFSIYGLAGLPYESMTDNVGAPHSDNNVSHTRREVVTGERVAFNQRGPLYSSGSYLGTCFREFEGYLPVAQWAYQNDGHLGALSGIKALAIARVPAYTQSQMEAFISLVEARELVDSSAAKAASALAQFGMMCYQSLRGRGPLKKKLSREAKRILDGLRRRDFKTPSTVREAWQLLLASMSAISNADMEWKYGYAPMIRDIQASSDAVAAIGGLRAALLNGKRVYGRAIEVRTSSGGGSRYSTDGYARAGGIDPFVYNYTKTTKTTGVASIVRVMNPNCDYLDVDWFTALDAVIEINGLNPSARRLWNLLPMSFVIDWFWNVGNLLESMQSLKAPIGTSIQSVRGLYSEKSVTNVTVSGAFANAIAPTSYGGSSRRTTYTRNVDSLTGGPALYIPPLNLPTKAGQWFSMAQIAFSALAEKIR